MPDRAEQVRLAAALAAAAAARGAILAVAAVVAARQAEIAAPLASKRRDDLVDHVLFMEEIERAEREGTLPEEPPWCEHGIGVRTMGAEPVMDVYCYCGRWLAPGLTDRATMEAWHEHQLDHGGEAGASVPPPPPGYMYPEINAGDELPKWGVKTAEHAIACGRCAERLGTVRIATEKARFIRIHRSRHGLDYLPVKPDTIVIILVDREGRRADRAATPVGPAVLADRAYRIGQGLPT